MLEVAEREFAREGFAGAHLQHIASQVGVQKTALYYYFPSKAALYEAVLVRMLEAFEGAVREAVDAPVSHRERMVRLLDGLNDLLAEHTSYSKILIRIFVDRVRMDGTTLRPLIERILGRLLVFFREGIDAGAFAKRSSRNLLQTLIGGLVFHYASDDFGAAVLDVDDIFDRSAVAWRREEVRGLLLGALLRDPPR
ncbi:MAG: helix-turn-helix domain-containing protein, partial [Myxococcota bacterium]|nr:helix-turn-helix domain-containing protein [Myxococcota bacterium]